MNLKLLLYGYLSSEDRWMMNTTKSILGRLSSFSTGKGRVFASLLYKKKNPPNNPILHGCQHLPFKTCFHEHPGERGALYSHVHGESGLLHQNICQRLLQLLFTLHQLEEPQHEPQPASNVEIINTERFCHKTHSPKCWLSSSQATC